MADFRKLAQTILELNPALPKAFKAKFEAMSGNAEFSSVINGVIRDCEKMGIKLRKEDEMNGCVNCQDANNKTDNCVLDEDYNERVSSVISEKAGGKVKKEPSKEEIIQMGIARMKDPPQENIVEKRYGLLANMLLAKRILDVNPDLSEEKKQFFVEASTDAAKAADIQDKIFDVKLSENDDPKNVLKRTRKEKKEALESVMEPKETKWEEYLEKTVKKNAPKDKATFAKICGFISGFFIKIRTSYRMHRLNKSAEKVCKANKEYQRQLFEYGSLLCRDGKMVDEMRGFFTLPDYADARLVFGDKINLK